MEKGARSTLVKPSAKRASFRWYVLEPLGSFQSFASQRRIGGTTTGPAETLAMVARAWEQLLIGERNRLNRERVTVRANRLTHS